MDDDELFDNFEMGEFAETDFTFNFKQEITSPELLASFLIQSPRFLMMDRCIGLADWSDIVLSIVQDEIVEEFTENPHFLRYEKDVFVLGKNAPFPDEGSDSDYEDYEESSDEEFQSTDESAPIVDAATAAQGSGHAALRSESSSLSRRDDSSNNNCDTSQEFAEQNSSLMKKIKKLENDAKKHEAELTKVRNQLQTKNASFDKLKIGKDKINNELNEVRKKLTSADQRATVSNVFQMHN